MFLIGLGDLEGINSFRPFIVWLFSNLPSSIIKVCFILTFYRSFPLFWSTYNSLNFVKISKPSVTIPKIVCFFYKEINSSSVKVIKNVDVFKFGPWLAVATIPLLLNYLLELISSLKYFFSIPLTKPNIDEGNNDF